VRVVEGNVYSSKNPASGQQPTREQIKPYINPNAPFGPVASEQMDDHNLQNQLFDRENRAS